MLFGYFWDGLRLVSDSTISRIRVAMIGLTRQKWIGDAIGKGSAGESRLMNGHAAGTIIDGLPVPL